MKIFRSWSGFKIIPQLFSTIEIVSVVATIEQQTIFRSDLLLFFNNLNIFLMNSNSFIRVRVQKKYFFEFKLEFGKTIEFFRVQVRVHSPVCFYYFNLLCVQTVKKLIRDLGELSVI